MAETEETERPPKPRINFTDTPPNHRYKASIEREEYPAELAVRLFKDVLVFLLAVGLVCMIAFLCGRALLSPLASPEEQKWAMSILSGMVGGVVGYLIKK